MLIKRKQTPSGFKTPKIKQPDKNRAFELSELNLAVLAAIWIGNAMLIYHLFQSTLIPLLTISRWYFLFGLVGFGAAFLLRKRLRLSILDGLYFNVFVTGPLCMLLFLGINQIGLKTYTEQYKIVDYKANGGKYTLELENKAYGEFWRIRNVSYDSRPARMHEIEFTFSDGLLGYKVLKDSRLY